MQKGDEVEVHYTERSGYGYDSTTHVNKKYEGCRGIYMEQQTGYRASYVIIDGTGVVFWDFDLRPAAPLSPFEAKVRAYIDKELR